MAKKIQLNDVTKKHLRIVVYLLGSWVIALALAYVLKNSSLVGLAPILNYLAYAVENELKGEGYYNALKK